MDILLVKKLLIPVESNLNDLDLKIFTRELMHIFLEIGSETPDNLNCCSHIEYGIVSEREFGPCKVLGLKIKDKNILLSDILNTVEDIKIPSEVRKHFPDLSVDEWRALTRMVTMILISIEKVIESP